MDNSTTTRHPHPPATEGDDGHDNERRRAYCAYAFGEGDFLSSCPQVEKEKYWSIRGVESIFSGFHDSFFVGRSADGGNETNDCEYPWGDDAWGVRIG